MRHISAANVIRCEVAKEQRRGTWGPDDVGLGA
jgi:hypothetical protein